MNLVSTIVVCLVLTQTAIGAIIDHDKVEPFAQPQPVTISENVAVKYKPQLQVSRGCVPFPAVNAAGEISGGLKGSTGTDGCTEAPLGSQVYGRSACRHLWANYVLWLDNPALETPKILVTAIPPMGFVGMQAIQTSRISRFRYTYNYTGGSDVSTRVCQDYPDNSAWIGLDFTYGDGQYQDLIMWNQLTDQAREALESADFGEDTKVPFNDKNFEAALGHAWPF
eukprot:jgi/Phyca11/5621/fgenesh1_pm.PHYCAscaffold_6_\